MKIINEFLYKHEFILVSEQSLINNYNEFKNILNKIDMNYSQNLLEFFGIDKNFDCNFIMPNLNNFNNLLKEIKELI